VLLRVESKAGHGAGRPTEKIIDDVADRFAFLARNLNFTPTL
jgi:prolyl oligopeptidase